MQVRSHIDNFVVIKRHFELHKMLFIINRTSDFMFDWS